MEGWSQFVYVLSIVAFVLLIVGAFIAAIYVQKFSNIGLNVVKYMILLFKDIFVPIYNIAVGMNERIDNLVYGGNDPPKIIKKLGGWRLILFMSIILIATIAMIIEICNGEDLNTLMNLIIENTSIGGLASLFEGGGINVTMCLDILLFSVFTGWFVKHCSGLSLPLQFVYDAIFIVFTALIIEKLPEFKYSFVSEEWWTILKLELPQLPKESTRESVVLIAVGQWLAIWNTLLNRLLLFVSLVCGLGFVFAAIGNFATSFLCGVISALLCVLVGYSFEIWAEGMPESLGITLTLLILIFIEVLMFNLDRFIPEKYKTETRSFGELMLEASDDESVPFGITFILLSGYFGTPILCLAILYMVATVFGLASYGPLVMIGVILLYILAFFVCCLPAIIVTLIVAKGDFREAVGSVFGVIKMIPLFLIFYVVERIGIWLLGAILKIG